MKLKRALSEKMSRSDLKEDITISAIGSIDQATIATMPMAFRIARAGAYACLPNISL